MRPRRTGKIERREWTREPKTRFVLFCEGSNTEPAYFAAIRKFFAEELPNAQLGERVRSRIAGKVIDILRFVERKADAEDAT